MSSTQTLQVPQHLAGTDLRPVLTLLPVASNSPHGGAEVGDGAGGKGRGRTRAVMVVVLGAHLATAGLALKDALGYDDFVWDTAGIARTPCLARIALLPVVGARQFTSEVKPKLEQAEAALRLQGG